ncbi:MAG: response regulator transcription factor [Ruminococcus sp.]|nr:response regulator transcription factor [Ruminococcus sp.]
MRFNIAVVDDIETDRSKIEEYIKEYFIACHYADFRIVRYESAEKFLGEYKKGRFQIVFLDICMSGMNGLELAGRLRMFDTDICIIFMSTTREFVFKTFSAEPKGYLCKPYKYHDFSEIMDRTIRSFSKIDKTIKVSISRTETEISASDVFSILSNNHISEIRTISGETYKSNSLFKEYEKILADEQNFLVCNRGIIVNMNYAVMAKDDKITMQDGTSYPIRQRDKKEIISKFTKYISARMRRKLEI